MLVIFSFMRLGLISILIISLALAGGCDLWTMDERGFDRYLTRWFEEKGVDAPKFSCEMNADGGRSRAGTCIFKINPKTFVVLIEKLQLESIPDVIGLKGCLTRKSFKSSFSGKQKFDVYKSKEPPGPIVSGNTSSSFQLLSFRKASGEGCIDVHYPYG